MLGAIPALPVKDITRSIPFYRDQLGFTLAHQEDGFAIFRRDTAEVHLWQANDETWQKRDGSRPVISGAESFIAGTASCRIAVEGINDLYERVLPFGIVHPNAPIRDQPWGDRDFSMLDPDGNLVTFFQEGHRV